VATIAETPDGVHRCSNK